MTDELLIKYLLQESSSEENLQIEGWLKDPGNQNRFQEFVLIWEESKKLQATHTVDEQDAWERFKLRRENLESTGKTTVAKTLFFSTWIKVAAVFVLVAGLWYTYTLNSSGYKQVITSGQVLSEILPDGSEITLNKNSDLSYYSSFKRNRSIRLNSGEVFFRVKPDKTHPFIIDADQVSIRVVGTAFNVRHQPDGTEVIVESGIVRVSYGGGFTELHKGEKVTIRPNVAVMQKQTVTDQLYNYYRTKSFIANNTPLKELVTVLNSAYQSDIKINDPVIQELTITTTFKEQKLEDILQIIADTHDLKVIHQGKEILLTK